ERRKGWPARRRAPGSGHAAQAASTSCALLLSAEPKRLLQAIAEGLAHASGLRLDVLAQVGEISTGCPTQRIGDDKVLGSTRRNEHGKRLGKLPHHEGNAL